MNVPFANNDRYAMRYEGIIGACFIDLESGNHQGTVRYEDPLSFSDADRYSRFKKGVNDPDFNIERVRFASAIGALVFRYPEGDHLNSIERVLSRLGEATTKEQIAEIIDDLIPIMESL